MEDFTINGAHNMNVETFTDFPKHQPFVRMKGASTTKVTSGHGSFVFQEFKTESYGIWVSEYQVQENATLVGTSDRSVVEMQFILAQDVDYTMTGLGKVRMPKRTFNLNYTPYVENKAFVKKGSRFITFDVHLPEEVLQEMVTVCPALHPFVERVCQRRFATFNSRAHLATNEMIDNIYTALRSPFDAELLSHYVESRIDSLVFSALGHSTGNYPLIVKPDEYENECLENVRDHLLNNLDRPATIKMLARKYAINECKLKKMFKDKYGTTLLGLVLKERMDKTCMLLKTTRMPISEIAYTVGYKSDKALINKFQMYYGMPPGEYRRLH